jgi:hypothetical protein
LDLDIDEIMGFTKTEVETMIEYYGQTGKIRHSTPELMEIMNQWKFLQTPAYHRNRLCPF